MILLYGRGGFGKSTVYSEIKEYQRAIEDYDQAIALDPRSAEAYINRGAAYRKLKCYNDSLEDFTQAFIWMRRWLGTWYTWR